MQLRWLFTAYIATTSVLYLILYHCTLCFGGFMHPSILFSAVRCYPPPSPFGSVSSLESTAAPSQGLLGLLPLNDLALLVPSYASICALRCVAEGLDQSLFLSFAQHTTPTYLLGVSRARLLVH